jgi:hypothetical protein
MAFGVLIVDDNRLFLEAACALLERDLIAESPAAGFVPKPELSADAIRRILDGRTRAQAPGARAR